MSEIDARYQCGRAAGIDDLEALLEAKLEAIDAALSEIEEDYDPGEDLEPDADPEPEPGEGCSIEEQLVEAYERHILSPQFFPRDRLYACLEDVLMSAQRGGMTPSGFRGAKPDMLLNLARELQLEYRAWIAARRM